MAYIGFIRPTARGGEYFTLYNDYLLDTGYVQYTGDWRIKQNGSFTNCSYYTTDTVLCNNPASDTVFQFQIETTTGTLIGTITGTLLFALPLTNISTTLVGTTIGEASRTLSVLYTSPKVNHYSYCQPLATCSSNYDLGDFRGYTHGAIGGGCLQAVGTSITFGNSGLVAGKYAKTQVQTVNRPWSSSRLRIYKGTTLKAETADINLANVANTMVVTASECNTNTTSADITETDWSASSWHYYAGSWQKDKEETFTVTKLKSPFTGCATGVINSPTVSGVITYNTLYTPTCYQLTIHHTLPTGVDVFYLPPINCGGSYSRSATAGTVDGWVMKAQYCGIYFTIGSA